jgi:hypothetical protein
MFIGELTKTILAPFEYAYLDGDGEYKSVTVKVWVKRLTFRETSAKDFRKQFEEADKDLVKLAKVIPPLIADWEFFADKECKTKCEITTEFLLERPPDFVPQLAACVMGVLAAQDPKAKPASLENGSAQKAKRASQTATS